MTRASTQPAVVNGVDLDAVATAVRSCTGVDDLDGGPPNARLASYLPGRKVDGIKVTDDLVTVQIRGVWDVPVTTVADQIRIAVAHLVLGRQVDIIVADLTPAPGYEPEPKVAPSVAATPTVAPAIEATPVAPAIEVTPVVVSPVAVPPIAVSPIAVPPIAVPPADVRTVPSPVDPPPVTVLTVTEPVVEPETEGDPVVWVSETPSDGDNDASTSVNTIPTPAAIPPRS